jgi:GNAT superfamily N-acetyltransferase
VQHNRAVKVVPSELAGIDWEIFWHCPRDDSLAGFAVFEEDEVAALATVSDQGDPVWEIGMDVVLDAKGRGLGRAVVSASAAWILRQGKTPMASVGPFNIPSARTLRSVGLRYLISDIRGKEGPFRVPPQPLGRPHPGADLYDYYPGWAMNRDIQPREAAGG